jgi:uncharacterized phage protein gp47/JayE
MTTNVPPVEFTAAGLVVPQEAEILAGVQADYNDAFGGNLNPALNTPQGQLASSTAAIVADSNAVLAEYVNQVNPDTADGFMQDAIARIYFLERSPGVPTNVACQCVGDFQTVIPVGAQAQDTSGNRYICTDGGTIPVSGTITLNFANIEDGPIPCPAGTLTTIYKAIPGWDTINNALDGIVGREVETREEFEFRRVNSVALNAHGSKEAIYGAVFDVEDVLDVFVTENVTDGVVNYGATNYPLAAHSVYVGVVGGIAQTIGQAIYDKKDLGCNMNGNTTVTVTDNSYTPPKPTYQIKFNRPTPLPILFAVNLANSTSLPTDIEALVKAAIIATFNGADGSARVRIGGLILASKFYNGVNHIGPEVSILSIKIGTVTATLDSVTAGIDQAPTVSEADIAVTIT